MFDLSAMIMADNATRNHLGSAHPTAPERPSRRRLPRHRTDALRHATVTALRRLADRLEPSRLEVAS